MKKYLTLFLIIVSRYSSAQVTFQNAYGGNYHDQCYSMVQSDDSCFVLAGTTEISGGVWAVYTVKIDQSGNFIWGKTYLGKDISVGKTIAKNSNGGYLIAGYTDDYTGNNDDIYLVNIDSTGTLLWSETIGGSKDDQVNSCVATSDGNFAIAGYTASYGTTNQKAFLMKVSNTGNVLWNKIYSPGNNYYTTINSMQQTNDGGFVMTGYTAPCAVSCYPSMVIIKTDSSGNIQWSVEDFLSGFDLGNFIKQTIDGGYIVTGVTDHSVSSAQDLSLLKTDSVGVEIWSKAFGVGAQGFWIDEASNGDLIIAGQKDFDILLMRTDVNGNLEWSKEYGDTNACYAFTVNQTADNGYAVAGMLDLSYFDFLLLKTDVNGNGGCFESIPGLVEINVPIGLPDLTFNTSSGGIATNINTTTGSVGSQTFYCISTATNETDKAATGISIYPNPSSGIINIFSGLSLTNGIIRIYNSVGENTFKENLLNTELNQINLNNFNSGIYFVEVYDEKNYFSKRIIIDRD